MLSGCEAIGLGFVGIFGFEYSATEVFELLYIVYITIRTYIYY